MALVIRFSTDTAAVLRTAEINADIVLKATNIYDIYTSDSKRDENVIRTDEVPYITYISL